MLEITNNIKVMIIFFGLNTNEIVMNRSEKSLDNKCKRIYNFKSLMESVTRMKKHISLCGAAIKKLKAKKLIWKAILCRRGVKGLVMVRRMKVLVSRFSAKRAYKGFDIDREVCLLIIHSYSVFSNLRKYR